MSAETTMRCEDVAPYLSAFADGELPEPLRSEVAEHVATCDACSATLASYDEIDELLADLPRSVPQPEALDQILLAVAAEDEDIERRRAIRSTWALSSIRNRLTELDMPAAERSSPRMLRPTRRSRWVSVALPAIAALMLVSVTLATFRMLPGHDQISPPTNQATPTPAPGNVTLQDTQRLVNAIKAQLPFKPVLPTYVPDGAILDDVSLGPPDSEIGDHALDVTWNIISPAAKIHLHEAPISVGLPDYAAMPTTSKAEWQIGNAPWQAMRLLETSKSKYLAVAQTRAGVAIALDVSVEASSPQAAAGQTILRLMSLSMDAPYAQMPAATDAGSARILPVSVDTTVAHYNAVALNSNGGVSWREDVYVAPCASAADPCQVHKTVALANSAQLYREIASGQRMLHLDDVQQTFTWQPLLPADQAENLNNTALPKVFYQGNFFLSAGILWYMGEASYKGQQVYRLLWTSAPTRTYVYVSKSTHQVVAVAVDAHADIKAGGPLAGTGALSCLRYTYIEYVTPDATTDARFAQTIPPGYTESQTPPLSLTC
jgi:anti-sigma factor RsiW